MTHPGIDPTFELIAPDLDPSAVIRSGRQGAPIVLLIHGLGSHERDLTGLVPFLPPAFEYVSVRGIYRYGPGFAWFEMPPSTPEDVRPAAEAVERFIDAQDAPVVGAVGFSQGGLVSLQVLRRNPDALRFVANLSGWPLPSELPGDAALAERRPPVFWGHGGLDPLYDPQSTERIRRFLTEHSELTEEERPYLGHSVDEVELRALASFLQLRADEVDPSEVPDNLGS